MLESNTDERSVNTDGSLSKNEINSEQNERNLSEST